MCEPGPGRGWVASPATPPRSSFNMPWASQVKEASSWVLQAAGDPDTTEMREVSGGGQTPQSAEPAVSSGSRRASMWTQ